MAIKQILCSSFLSLLIWSMTLGQETASAQLPVRPVRNTFESVWLIDNQTVMVSFKGTFEWDIQHRFGTIENGYDDYFGLAAPSNIRLGFHYVPIENLQVGFGITKGRKVWDFNAKYAIVKQMQSGGFPFSVSYFVNAGIDSRDNDEFAETIDRFSYFHQLMIARKVSEKLSIQLSPSLSYFNFPEPVYNNEGSLRGHMNNNHFALSTQWRFKISNSTSIISDLEIPLTEHEFNDPVGNVSFGVEFTTSAHAFQLFLGNFQSLSPQHNRILNQYSFGDGELLIGFNLTRLWNF